MNVYRTGENSGKADFVKAVEATPHEFDFFGLVRTMDALHPERDATGRGLKCASEELRFGNEPAPFFATSTLSSVTNFQVREDGPTRLRVLSFFMGLTGPNGPLPLRLTEFVYRRLHGIADSEDDSDETGRFKTGGSRPDNTFAAFLNLFEHRLISLLYRAWADVRKTVDYDRPDGRRFHWMFGSLHGEGAVPIRTEAITLDDRNYFCGHLGRRARNSEGLARILSDFFETPVAIRENVGNWLDLPPNGLCRLGEERETGIVGHGLVVGSRYWDCQLRYRITIGPMRFTDYERFFVPDPVSGGATCRGSLARRALIEWVRSYTALEFFVDVQLVLKKEEVPEIALGCAGRLGYSTWLRDKPVTRSGSGLWEWKECPPLCKDADDLDFELELEPC